VPATGGPGALLLPPFNMRWRFSALAGDVEGSKLCLLSVIMPAKCVSSISPRFHYRRLTFCFLPLAAILDLYFINFNVNILMIISPSSRGKIMLHTEYSFLKLICPSRSTEIHCSSFSTEDQKALLLYNTIHLSIKKNHQV
jgi:hypothetical protein